MKTDSQLDIFHHEALLVNFAPKSYNKSLAHREKDYTTAADDNSLPLTDHHKSGSDESSGFREGDSTCTTDILSAPH